MKVSKSCLILKAAEDGLITQKTSRWKWKTG